jgi:hypothetical protein
MQRMLDALGLDAADRHRALRRLTSMQSIHEMTATAELLAPKLSLEFDELELLEKVEASIDSWGAPRLSRLQRLVRVRILRGIERIIRLLAMLYPPTDLAYLHRALRSQRPKQRAAAVEFLHALVDIPDKHRLIRVVERAALPELRLSPMERNEGLSRLLLINDTVLRSYAAWCAVRCNTLYAEVAHMAAHDPSRRVRAIARWALGWRTSGKAGPSVPPPIPPEAMQRSQAVRHA